jgi:hypothetical protein
MLSPHRACEIFLSALLLGLLGDLLLRPGPSGLGAGAWVLASAGAAIAFRSERASLGALALSAAFGLLIVWRDSPVLQGLFAGAAIVAWGVAFLDRPARAGVTALAMAACAAVGSAIMGSAVVFAGARSGERLRLPRRSVRVALGGAALAAPLLVLFGTLFAAADPLFARYTAELGDSLDEALDHLVVIAALAWVMEGLLAGLHLARCPAEVELPRPRPAFGSAITVAVALVVGLFAAFLVVQARALIGGAEWVESRLGLSYSEYARGGFFQLLACAGIALPLGVIADWAVAPEDPRRKRARLLSLALTVVVLAVVASAARRMALYVEAYGLTELRLYASATTLWLALAAITFGMAAIRGSRGRFCFHALLAAAAVIGGLGIVNPGARIAAYNASRGPSGTPFDAGYAVSLGADAVPALLEAMPALTPDARCATAQGLLAYGAGRPDDDWRTYTVSRARARSLLDAADGALRHAAAGCDQPPRRDA